VKQHHEQTLMELCMIPDEEEEKSDNNYLNDCLNVINTENEEYDDEEDGEGGGDCEDGDMNCMLDTMFDVWNDEFEGNKKVEEEVVEEEEVKKPERPWASRSSPSGTYVRDPVTRKLKNIG